MKSPVILLIFLLSADVSLAQGTRLLEIYSITEYADGYLLNAIDRTKGDTLNIVSVDTSKRAPRGYEKMFVGGNYEFELENPASAMAASSGSIVIRIRTTVVWKNGDPIKKMPVFAKNTKGAFIIRKK